MADDLLKATLEHLRALVGFKTPNPPREMRAGEGIFAYIRSELSKAPGDFIIEEVDLGEGCVWLYARRGQPDLLFNVHLDTVPAAPDYSADPWTLRIEEGRAIGLGACDIKGAAAALIAAAQSSEGPCALLFSSDEEAGQSRCVREFCARAQHAYDAVLVAEPTGVRAVLAHRGIRTFSGTFHGRAGHSSGPRALEESALHNAARWIAGAVEHARQARDGDTRETANSEVGGWEITRHLRGHCFNVGVVEGGKKPNIVAPSAFLRWGIRPRPGDDPGAVAQDFMALAEADAVTWQDGFVGPSLPADFGPEGHDLLQRASEICARYALPAGPAVDFWTEAALFSQAGLPAIVFGPGDIAQAHTADEFVALEDLERIAEHYRRLMSPAIA
ncbi:acetylornithine deacetylase [Bradymonadaceae bacterium TMQ3]|uniref:N-acetyl-L-citrulline deacetylase n=1 Tax=Lujinxingia sediminis TaxID=2480984 RepID=A0ABY0CU37_9DELT|nr:acetylornithine deacetylase [Lujinxingia sediminis]RDV38631.1 acetylornithine deacetylase [Bradymonadaceae bacterium TMQ3]RVU44818.1 acetylornithine deacetylase [Lujinxingia sediminis]TXC76597.1 acetylornithine deacetylase [Bradymonadales bacterium TMQ1]